MTFKAKSAAVMLVALLLVYGWYFAQVLVTASEIPVDEIAYQPLLFVMVAVLVVLAVIGQAVLTALAPKEADEEDERDRLIEMRGDRTGGYALAVLALVALALAMLEVHWFWIAHVILAGLVLGEITKSVAMLVDYRRGV